MESSSISFSGLRKFNAIMGFFHFAQGVLMLVLSTKFTLPITTLYVKFDKASLKLVSDLKEPAFTRPPAFWPP